RGLLLRGVETTPVRTVGRRGPGGDLAISQSSRRRVRRRAPLDGEWPPRGTNLLLVTVPYVGTVRSGYSRHGLDDRDPDRCHHSAADVARRKNVFRGGLESPWQHAKPW